MKWDVDWIEARVRLLPEKTAVIDSQTGQRWTYRQIYHRSQVLACWMGEAGIQAGDRVALLSPNHIAFIDLLFACRRLNAIFVPLNWRLSEQELHEIIDDCQPKLLACHSQFEHMARCLADRCLVTDSLEYEQRLASASVSAADERPAAFNMDTPWMMIYTGGTTGKPKGAVLTNRSVYTNSVNTVLSWDIDGEDVTLTVLPMFHTGGLNALTLPVLHAGGTVVLCSGFEAETVIDLLNRYQITIVLMVPTMYHMLIHCPAFKESSFPSVKVFLSGGAPCPPVVYEAFARKGLPFKEGYGLTEAGPNNFYISPEQARLKPGSVGKPMLYNWVKLVDSSGQEVQTGEVGELVIRGEHLFSHYWNNPQATQDTLRDGWLYTGDLARIDEDGDFYIMGRRKDMIISGGENVYPQEVEKVLGQHPDVREVAVVGLPDPKWGEVVAAIVVLKEGEKRDEEGLKAYCATKLARYKVPKRIYFVPELPKTHVGKIDKQQLVAAYQQS